MLDKIIQAIGFAVCHQLPSRSLYVLGKPLPVCARDTGLYMGALFTFIYLQLAHHRRESDMPSAPVMITCFGLIFLMALDGLTSYLGWRSSTNDLRLLTGLGAGAAVAIFIFPVFNYQLWQSSSDSPVLGGFYRPLGCLGVILAVFIILKGGSNLFFLPFLVALSIIFVFAMVNLLIISLLPPFERKAKRWVGLLPAFAIALVMTSAELIFSYGLHAYVLSLVS